MFLDTSNSCTISVRVQPRASRDRIAGWRDGVLRVSVSAPPLEGRANAAVLELLADRLGVAKSRLRIVRGLSSRDKAVAVDGMVEDEVLTRLNGRGTP